jgi:tRNA(fMet)-specific endonuclease VapC
MVRYLLDTDTCSYAIRERPAGVRERMNAISLEEQAISVVTYAELMYGVARSSNARVNREVVAAFVRHVPALSWTADAAEHYGEIRAALEVRGAPIGAMDLMIAAHARSLGAAVVTRNLRHFSRVPGLAVENWA